jgi:hypothetical protein
MCCKFSFEQFHQMLIMKIVAAWFDILMFFQLLINVHKCKACFITQTEISKWKEVLVYLSRNYNFLILLNCILLSDSVYL